MELATTIEQIRQLVRAARAAGKRIGFVPTMGALHQGHIALINTSVRQCDFTVISIFVNPTQFGPTEDFERYPRPLEKDLRVCRDCGVDVVFAPSTETMYPRPNLTWVVVEKLTEPLCGRFRPGHFRGVTTVCTKLFNIVQPDVAYFGQKDAQQAVVVRRMVEDLNMPLEIVVCPTVRDPDGLATSSRNVYLTDSQRRQATRIYQALQHGQRLIVQGLHDPDQILQAVQDILQQAPDLQPEYVSLVDAETLEPIEKLSGRVLLAVAARIGSARLIDNIVVDCPTD